MLNSSFVEGTGTLPVLAFAGRLSIDQVPRSVLHTEAHHEIT
jgi:hypothetical protein